MPISAPAALIGTGIALLVGGACGKWAGSAPAAFDFGVTGAGAKGSVIDTSCNHR